MKTILAANDGSESAKRAFQFALQLAKAFGSSVVVVSVAQPSEPPTSVETPALLDAATEHFEKDFVAFREAAQAAGVPLETDVVVGHPADQIVHQAVQRQADMIVMGHRGKSRFQRWLLGSVSKRVLSYAPCTVTVVR
ncbi:MAG TPA: universal stress protein [Phycisphaerae bacterium]|nr:universal stress protein [Phycisphaerae bacterium]HRR84105.1 universal stress protein [Phycisphaerae bacterium]